MNPESDSHAFISLLLVSLCCCGSSETGGGASPDGGSLESSTDAADAAAQGQDAESGTADTAPPEDAAGTGRAHCKRGIAYGNHTIADLGALSKSISWWYNWTHVPDQQLAGAYEAMDVEYVPMVWGENFDVAKVVDEAPDGIRTLLGFNEPNFFSQANMSAARSAELWPSLEQIASQRQLSLVSPAVNFCGGGCHDTDPINYLEEFFAACSGCRVDAIAVHVYVGCSPDGPTRAKWLIEKIEGYKQAFSQPIWLTEFACDDAATLEEQRLFMQDAVAWLENEPRVARYAWFSGRTDAIKNADLLSGDGELTPLGEAYVSLPQAEGCTL